MEYVGRMVCDGNGNLLADEGERAGDPIAYDESTDGFIFLKPGEASHNARHHKQFTTPIVATQDLAPDLPGYAGTKDNPTEGNEHHWGPTEDDPHYEEGATDQQGRVTNTRLVQLPDSQSRLTGGHTHQHKVGA